MTAIYSAISWLCQFLYQQYNTKYMHVDVFDKGWVAFATTLTYGTVTNPEPICVAQILPVKQLCWYSNEITNFIRYK